jgi:hypothetical protein
LNLGSLKFDPSAIQVRPLFRVRNGFPLSAKRIPRSAVKKFPVPLHGDLRK